MKGSSYAAVSLLLPRNLDLVIKKILELLDFLPQESHDTVLRLVEGAGEGGPEADSLSDLDKKASKIAVSELRKAGYEGTPDILRLSQAGQDVVNQARLDWSLFLFHIWHMKGILNN